MEKLYADSRRYQYPLATKRREPAPETGAGQYGEKAQALTGRSRRQRSAFFPLGGGRRKSPWQVRRFRSNDRPERALPIYNTHHPPLRLRAT